MNKNQQMERKISAATRQMIPGDMYERITQSVAQEERTMNMSTITAIPTTKKKRNVRWLAVAAAACLLLVCGLFGSNYYLNNIAVDSLVDIDVNPGVEITTNKKDVVLSATAVNSDGEKVLDGMDLKNTQLKVAVNAIIGSMVQNGYLVDGESGILVTVENEDAQRASHVRNIILSNIDATLKSNHVTASVVNQTVEDISSARAFAQEQGISLGKAMFVLNLSAKDSTLDTVALASMSLGEIAALVKEKNMDITDIVDYDGDDSIWENIQDAVEDVEEKVAPALTLEQAKGIALNHAQVDASEAVFRKEKLDYDDGVPEFDLKFIAGSKEYEYEIHGVTGGILSYDVEVSNERADSGIAPEVTPSPLPPASGPESQAPPETSPSFQPSVEETQNVIPPEDAKSIALSHAGLSTASYIKAELDWEDGIQVYEVEFHEGGMEYDYEINAVTGSIIHYEWEVDD